MLNPRTILRLWVLLLLTGGLSSLEAQLNRGIIEGIVTDPSGATVPGVEVTVTNVDTNITVPTKTNGAGYYSAVDLVPGKYRARFVAAGFAPMEVTDIELLAGRVIRVDTQLKLGAARESVEVTAEVPLLETAASNFSSTLESRTIQDVPMQGRDIQQLVFLVPGVNNVGGPPGSNFGFNSAYGSYPDPTHVLGSDLSVNGGQGGANAWYLDGNLNLSNLSENVVVNPSPDAVSEFQAITNAFSAENGRTGGAVFSVVLKSGTNALHGNIYEYVRNNATNARNPFKSFDALGNIIPQRALRFNNFGGTLAGPVVLPHIYNGKNKTFFFFSWDTQILHLLDSNQVFTVPSPLMRQGDFSEDANTLFYGIRNPFSTVGPDSNGLFARSLFGTPTPGNPNGCTAALVTNADGSTTAVNPTTQTCNFATQIPSMIDTPLGSRPGMDPTAMFFMQSFPLPNYVDPLAPYCLVNGVQICNNFRGAVGSSNDPQNISIKIDHQINEKNKLFGEWLFNPTKYDNYRLPWTGPTFPDSIVGFGSNFPLHLANQIIALGNTYTFGPTLINDFRAGFSRQFMGSKLSQPYPDSVSAQTAVEQQLAPFHIPFQPYNPTPLFNIGTPDGGFITFGPQGWVNMVQAAEAYTILDNVTKVVGKHTLKTGFIYRVEHQAWLFGGPTILSSYGGVTSDPITGLGGGGLQQFMMGAVSNDAVEQVNFSPYLRFRYWGFYAQDDFRITPRFTLNIGLRYDLNGLFKLRQHPMNNFCLNCPNPNTGLRGIFLYEGDAGLPKNHDIAPANKNSVAPRINFAWTPFADRKTVIRGGYDIFYSNSFQGANAPQSGANDPGFNIVYPWDTSFYPNQCANFSGQCVAFPLSDPTTIKRLLPIPQIPADPSGLPGASRDPLYVVNGISFFTPPRPRDPMVQNWNLQVQRQLPANMMVSVGYVGTHGTHLMGELFRNFNYVHTKDVLRYRSSIYENIPITDIYSGKTADLLQKVYASTELPRSILLLDFPFYAPFGLIDNTAFDGTSVYHALDFLVQKRFSHGLNFTAAYTVSKEIDNALVTQLGAQLVDPVHFARPGYIGGRAGATAWSNGGFGGVFQDKDNKKDRVIAADDIPQMLNVAATYELPLGSGKPLVNRKGAVNQIVGGWRLTTNLNVQSGVPLAISCPGNQVTSRCNLIGNPQFSGSRSRQQQIADWINPAAFEPPFGSDQNFWANYDPNDDRAYHFGTAGPRLPGIRSPGFWNLDAAMVKEFHITESRYFQFRWEVFNALNHQSLVLPNTNFCLPPKPDGSTDRVHQAGCRFGQITNIQTDPRSMQFALKFYW